MRFLIILILSLIALSLNAQIIKSNAIMELNNMDFSTPCTSCSEWRYSRNTNFLYRWNGTSWIIYNPGSTLNLGLSMPGIFNVSPSTLAGSGTFNVTLNSQAQNTFLAAPSNASGVPTFRTLTPSDLSVAGGLSGTSSAGRVAFYTGTSTLTGDANLTWDNSDKSLSLGGSGVSSSLLTLNSTTRGILIPRMTTTEKNAIVAPATGLLVYDLTLGAFNVYNGSAWVSVGGGLPAGSNGQIQFNNNNVFGASSNLFWDNANSRLGIGTNTPAHRLHVSGTSSRFENPSGNYELDISGGGSLSRIAAQSTGFALGTLTNNPVIFWVNASERMRINSTTGNVGINSQSPSARLHVVGSGNTSSTTSLLVQNNTSTNLLSVTDDGTMTVPNNRIVSNGMLAFAGTLGFRSNLSINAGNYILFDNNDLNIATTSGITNHLVTRSTYAPASGTGVFNEFSISPIINQTGGANGITRGLYIAPTLTSAADWRSIQFDNNTGWGLYGNGTANNYLAGNLAVGTTSIGARLSVRGSGSDNNASSILIQNSLARTLFSVRNDGLAQLGRNTAVTTQSVAQIEVVSDDTNTGLVLTPKGTGAIIAGSAPDGTVTGGNARGVNAVDLQIFRDNANAVAASSYSTITGGRNNEAVSSYSSIAGGQDNRVLNTYGSVSGGYQAASYLYGQAAIASGRFSSSGDAQTSEIRLRREITGQTQTELFLDGISVKAILRADNRVWNAIVQCTGVVNIAGNGTVVAGNALVQTFNLGIKRIGTSTSIMGNNASTQFSAGDTNMAGANFTVDADDANEALRIQFTPPTAAGTTTVTRCHCTVRLNEVGF